MDESELNRILEDNARKPSTVKLVDQLEQMYEVWAKNRHDSIIDVETEYYCGGCDALWEAVNIVREAFGLPRR